MKRKTHQQFLIDLEGYNITNPDFPMELLPNNFYINNKYKLQFRCRSGHEFSISPAKLIDKRQGCLKCKSVRFKASCLAKYGVENPSQLGWVREKVRQTCLDRYGVDHHWKLGEIREKSKLTLNERYGVKNPQQNKKIREKTILSNLEIYGVDNPAKSEVVKEKTKQTNLERYGVVAPSQIHYLNETLDKLNSFEYLYEEYINNNKTSRQIAEKLNIDKHTVCNYLRKHDIQILKAITFSKIAIQWLESIMNRDNIFIQHALNGGEYRIPGTRLLVDGYCKDTNTIYEFYGDCFHGNLDVYKEEDYPHPFDPNITTMELYNKTIEREEKIKELGYRVETIWEKDYSNIII